ncbi:hypothetical protein GFC01_02380 [Desulfofundulus thermobenzoicus]|uniref:Uncharacterized protein n=1 Tax=Desulfofundulus thermobenzoicus TaxID=29376 RepID=A0A6N7IMF3_9FIRM|nr:hypothetical protein [Desulfofundulus thermobenzoicus]MQL51131.1 hypothetical protein [Desulfofundulus thermobenzoicus]
MRLPFFKIKTPPCPACGSTDTTTGRMLRIAAGLGVGGGGSILCYLLGFLYPMGRIIIPLALLCGAVICFIPPLGKYCCLSCDAYWNPDNPKVIWRPRDPGL